MHFAVCKPALLLLLALLVAGCTVELGEWSTTRRIHEDAVPDQPWVGVDQRAEASLSVRRTPMGGCQWLEWQVSDGKWIEARDIAARARDYLHRRDAWAELGLQRTDYGEEKVVKVQKILLITSLEPLVVLIGPGETLYLENFGGGTFPHQMNSRLPDDTLPHPVRILPYGFRYGTSLPYSQALQWFSPDLEIGPEPVAMTSEETGRIEMPWGYLLLKHEGNQWVVTTASAK